MNGIFLLTIYEIASRQSRPFLLPLFTQVRGETV
jgi:hypothetical protein